MAANGSGVQFGTLRSILLAWILTLPCAVALSASLDWFFTRLLSTRRTLSMGKGTQLVDSAL